ncbi:aminobenzoyl-glutamate transport protein [Salinibacter ruber]|uniref:Aminobenzoyl-glutamate transport protein n=1 Tax=Salinibacter ruber TaxID=146919 RepID=A0A9X2PZK4_9BACT|nr:AbgT family transporter [Salinibacter ruber]MCS3636249.1 aminobenzoyl-glutamate transport protein [Salinibacter ruber]MCS3669942.1 aminobenzoyl-glutamate transport protein [Salinibacter ruber]MCS3676883.1 aminobenzoyl-glutamate transport protein [Salinibacter ruber]MCS3680171.1 aminobenzoyl-glutamate transport protein [Salinibacter ruber]MCS3706555.1 aminobenzoyl-glutamate transport protein [Salinibacter ruber]
MSSDPAPTDTSPSWSDRWLNRIERTGNALPDPVTLFFIFIAIVMVASWITHTADVSVVHPGTDETITADNLFSDENIRRLFTDMAETFADFPPLGLVLVVMLGIGVADKTGLISAALKSFVASVPDALLTAALVFAGIMSSLAVDAGYVVVIPLGAVLFYGVGRHPLAGLGAAFAGVSAGFSANLLLTSLDPLLASFTEPAAQLIAEDYSVPVTANWYLMIALTPVFVVLGAYITDTIVEPYLGEYEPPEDFDEEDAESSELTDEERRGLRWAGGVTLASILGVVLLAVPEGAPLAEFEALIESIVALMVFLFFLPGLTYGIVVGEIEDDSDVADMMADSMADMGAYIVLAFAAAHFIAMFEWSNLGSIIAISGADALQSIGFTGLPLLFSFIFVSALINLFVGSASAKWAIMAPVFVPMLMLAGDPGYSPETVQAAYRIGDSFTNILTPLLPYFPLVIIFAQRYDEDAGIGSIIALMLPYSIGFGVVSTIVFLVWVLLGLPLGPGAELYYMG